MNTNQRACTGPELVVGRVTGVRAWRVAQDGRLRSLHHRRGTDWAPGETKIAACHLLHHDYPYRFGPCEKPPTLGCKCGIYAYHKYVHDGFTFDNLAPDTVVTVGVVEAFGRVLVGSRGFRAEKVRVRGLIVCPRTANRLVAERPPPHVRWLTLASPRAPRLRTAYPEIAIHEHLYQLLRHEHVSPFDLAPVASETP